MFRSASLPSKYEIPHTTVVDSTKWLDNHMYKSSYHVQSEKNALAMKNSTDQFLKTKSNNLFGITPKSEYFTKSVENTDFVCHDYHNLYRTTYTDMSQKAPKLLNTHFIPGYQGFVSGMKSENPFGKNTTKLSIEKAKNKDYSRFTGSDFYNDNFKQWQFNPLSKSIGSFTKPEFISTNKSLDYHNYTVKLRESGYTNNYAECDKQGWLPQPVLHSDMNRTEYRIQYNKKPIHYQGPMFSTGKLKMKESVYKHT